ncbi:hypothetical protein NXH67_11645 [Butyrivibrio sp. DSM 10294]|uniref:hypothetical protein n=1 Tax=Butyrivibrio sp. DSM 10294 TaxID=2972457 RepID=UPI00234EDD19|nr:hypothetical protein [Butyrivibrio sp. DSM 10294]MDC7294166.1 hypothetical protein [Butyrivibrio sp. DSM 10294]
MPFYIHPDKVKTYGELFATAALKLDGAASDIDSIAGELDPSFAMLKPILTSCANEVKNHSKKLEEFDSSLKQIVEQYLGTEEAIREKIMKHKLEAHGHSVEQEPESEEGNQTGNAPGGNGSGTDTPSGDKPDWYDNTMQMDGDSPQEKWMSHELQKYGWTQEKVDALYDACRAIYDTYGIEMDPRMMMAIIVAEANGSFNTSSTNKAADGQNGYEANYALDVMKANDLMFGKVLGYILYHDKFDEACKNSDNLSNEGGFCDYANWYTPIVDLDDGVVRNGVYAGANDWGNAVEKYYEKMTHPGAAQEYTEYLKSIDPSVVKDIAPDISIPDVEFSEEMDGQDCGGHRNDTWTIGVEGRSY